MLVETSKAKTGRRLEIELRDADTGRMFSLVHYFNASRTSDPLQTMNIGKQGGWTASEYHPNGRLVTPDNKRGMDIANFDKSKKTPSKAWAAVKDAEAAHPGMLPVSMGGGRGISTIYHPNRAAAMNAIENALLTDTWVIENEPIRQKQLNPKCRIDLDADALLNTAAGKGQILAAIRDLTDMLGKNEDIEVSEHLNRVRITVRREGVEYPDNLRLMLDYDLNGRVTKEGHAFSRVPYYEIADTLAGRQVPHYDRMATRGLPAYGMAMATPAPLGALCVRCLHNHEGTSNKIYAHVTMNGTDYAVWGKFDKGGLSAKPMSYSEITERTWKKKGEQYEETDEDAVPTFWERAAAAIEKAKQKAV